MNKMLKVAIAALISVTVMSGPAYSFGLGGVTRKSENNIRVPFMTGKRRTTAPFAHVVFCVRTPAECAATSGPNTVDLTIERKRELMALNRDINLEITPVNDSGADTWSVAPTTGDCDDYAVTKRHVLIAKGWPAAALRLAVARTAWGEGHLVLVVRTSKGDLVLDNMTGALRHWNKTGLQWEMIQSSENPRIWYQL
jgi:predicted transglutaminase-like cysteine proteinase